MAKIPKSDVSDMSIDELSAAIDAHMETVASVSAKPKKATEKDPTIDEKVEAAVKKISKNEVPAKKPAKKQPVTRQSKIAVKKSEYITKADEKPKTESTAPSEPSGRISAGKRDLKPVSKNTIPEKSINKPVPTKVAKTLEPQKGRMVQDVIAQKPADTAASKPVSTERSVAPEAAPATKETQPLNKSPVRQAPKEESPSNSEENQSVAKSSISSIEKTAPEHEVVANSSNNSPPPDDLSAQIVEQKAPDKATNDANTLKTFDTKQYHIPIKPSRHHRAGSSFMVFIAVLATILATVYVLTELEIIDLASLFYPN